jgi:hypothetical protein
MKPTSEPTATAVKVSFYPRRQEQGGSSDLRFPPEFQQENRAGKEASEPRVKKMMMAEVANHSKRNHADSYFSGKAVAAAAAATGPEEFGSMSSKKPRNTSPRIAPVSPKVRTL